MVTLFFAPPSIPYAVIVNPAIPSVSGLGFVPAVSKRTFSAGQLEVTVTFGTCVIKAVQLAKMVEKQDVFLSLSYICFGLWWYFTSGKVEGTCTCCVYPT